VTVIVSSRTVGSDTLPCSWRASADSHAASDSCPNRSIWVSVDHRTRGCCGDERRVSLGRRSEAYGAQDPKVSRGVGVVTNQGTLKADPLMPNRIGGKSRRVLATIALTYWVAIAVLALSDLLVYAAYLTMPSWYAVGAVSFLVLNVAPAASESLFSWHGNVLLVLLAATLNALVFYWVFSRLLSATGIDNVNDRSSVPEKMAGRIE
jgi:hypothetical protein